MQIIAISISLQPDIGVVLIEKNGTKKKREKSALEDTISEITIKKSTNGSSGGSTISSFGGNSQAGNAFGGRA